MYFAIIIISGKNTKTNNSIFRNIALFTLAIAVGYLVITSEEFQSLLLGLTPVTFIAELIAGGFYTSLLTIPISISLLSVLVQEGNIIFIAAVGAIGATFGDFIIMNIFQKAGKGVKIKSTKWNRMHKSRPIKALLTLTGVICLALPVPDEVAMGILGITRITVRNFILIVYPAKVLGLLAVLLSLQSLQ